MGAHKSSKSGASAGAGGPLRKLPFDDDLAFQVRQWRVERFAWVAMVLVIVAALAGVFGGGGIIDRATATDAAGSTEVEYARFARYSSPTTLDITTTAAGSGRSMRIRVSDQYLSQMNLREITPPPTSTAIADRQQVFMFERAALPGRATVRFELAPSAIGRHHGWIAVDDAAPLSFTHFIYP